MPAKSDNTPEPEDEGAPQVFDLTVEEFCARTSAEDSRIELLAGFYSDEKANGRFKDSIAAYAERYAAYANRPI